MKAFYTEEVIKTKYHLTDYAKQKLAGVALIALGIIACIAFKEDAGAGIMLVLMGTAVLVSKGE